jgi:two-component system response regulator NreC
VYPLTQLSRSGAPAAKNIRCVLVHGHLLMQQGLRRLLEDETDLEVVGVADNATEALQRVFELKPDVVLVDARTFGLSAGDAGHLIQRESPQTKVLFLRMYEEDPWLVGPGGEEPTSVVRHTSAEELVQMVRNLTHHDFRTLSRIPSKTERRWPQGPETLSPRPSCLTAREREVLKFLAEGKTVRATAEILLLSAKTVDAHKFNLMRKLGIHNKAELVTWAIQQRVVIPARVSAEG